MMTIADRLKAARENAGFPDATSAARRFGWKPPTYLGHEGGTRGVKADVAAIYAQAFRVTPEWLLYGGEPSRAAIPNDLPAAPGNQTLVPIFNIRASAGPGAIASGHEEIIDQLAFPPGYLRHVTRSNTRDLAIVEVKGDSMIPTLKDDDLVMLDTSKKDLSYEGLFVIRDGGEALLVKRIGRATRRGFVMIISDNRNVPAVERAVDDIEVIGKVIWMGVKV